MHPWYPIRDQLQYRLWQWNHPSRPAISAIHAEVQAYIVWAEAHRITPENCDGCDPDLIKRQAAWIGAHRNWMEFPG